MILTTAFQLSCATFLISLRAFESSISFTLGLEEKFKCTTTSRDFGFSKKLGSMPKPGDSSSSLLMFWSLSNNAELLSISYGGPKVSRQFQFHHGNFNFVHGNFNFITVISISPRQFQLRSRQFQLRHGNFDFTTAISTSFTANSISSRQFQLRSRQIQFRHGNFNFTTAISTSSRQFQFYHGNFHFVHGNFNFITEMFFINSDRPARLSRACFSRF